ncbi:hypothetical protein NJB18091_38220 [Mycobacterium marinum]|nr:hypothetical protein MPSD_11220 [Mycobacterium pseudoshottsii JCM 15466]GJO02792.1 hypothetical protein NJB18091_38220 [Mycobacterium marinum]GJO52920.1 hypothetical protein NJB1604_43130 [Mycobacterium marinum]
MGHTARAAVTAVATVTRVTASAARFAVRAGTGLPRQPRGAITAGAALTADAT